VNLREQLAAWVDLHRQAGLPIDRIEMTRRTYLEIEWSHWQSVVSRSWHFVPPSPISWDLLRLMGGTTFMGERVLFVDSCSTDIRIREWRDPYIFGASA